MPLTLIQKLQLIESHHWQSLGYQFLDATAKEAADEIARLRHSLSSLAILHRYRMAEGGGQVFVGTSCEVCEAEADDRNLRHTAECPLSVLNPE